MALPPLAGTHESTPAGECDQGTVARGPATAATDGGRLHCHAMSDDRPAPSRDRSIAAWVADRVAARARAVRPPAAGAVRGASRLRARAPRLAGAVRGTFRIIAPSSSSSRCWRVLVVGVVTAATFALVVFLQSDPDRPPCCSRSSPTWCCARRRRCPAWIADLLPGRPGRGQPDARRLGTRPRERPRARRARNRPRARSTRSSA